jgi:hypothetical protein
MPQQVQVDLRVSHQAALDQPVALLVTLEAPLDQAAQEVDLTVDLEVDRTVDLAVDQAVDLAVAQEVDQAVAREVDLVVDLVAAQVAALVTGGAVPALLTGAVELKGQPKEEQVAQVDQLEVLVALVVHLAPDHRGEIVVLVDLPLGNHSGRVVQAKVILLRSKTS